jgi:hypothetical protein
MGALLERIDDPRDALQRARRSEMYEFAKINGFSEITEDLPADDIPHQNIVGMRTLLRRRGIYKIPVPERVLGDYSRQAYHTRFTPPASEKPIPPLIDKPVAKMSMTEMRHECKRRGIKMVRTDNMLTLKDKLGG